MSCGGGFFTPGGAYDSVWDSVRPLTGKYTQLFLVPRGRGYVCMLNGWFSSNDTICADNYIYFRFKLQACVAVRSGICICTAICLSRWTVIAWKCCPGGVPPLWFFTLGNESHSFYELCLPSERGMGMSMPLAVPVSSGKFGGTCVSTAPAVEPDMMSFTVSLARSTIDATAAVVFTCSALADCTDSVAPMCSSGACVALSCDGGRFPPDGAVHCVTR